MGILLIVLQYLKYGNYIQNLGSISLINLIPLSIGAAYTYYNNGTYNIHLAILTAISLAIGMYLGSLFIVHRNLAFSQTHIQLLNATLCYTIGTIYLISAIKHF